MVFAFLLLEMCRVCLWKHYISRFIATLNKIKAATGLYIIMEASNYDWLEYASGNTTYEQLHVIPTKKNIMATKLINLSREYLGKCIQFFTGHGWWNKHLKITNLNDNTECRLCCEVDSVESPIHIFEECVAMVSSCQGLFDDPFPSQLVGRASLCQVAELALVSTVRDLTDIDQNYSNVSLTE